MNHFVKKLSLRKYMLTSLLLLGAVSSAWAQLTVWPEEAADTTSTSYTERSWYDIYMLTRGYDEEIVVRWAPSEFVPWDYLNRAGYRLIRSHFSGPEGLVVDTLAHRLRPLSLDGFKEKFGAADSLAAIVAEYIYAKGTTLDVTEARPGTPGSILEVYDEQQQRFGYSMLIAERRPDIAEAMGLAYHDRDVKPGVSYRYAVEPLVPDTILGVRQPLSSFVALGTYEPESLTVTMSDSIVPPNTIMLQWDPETHSSFNIERRELGAADAEWHQLNTLPYVAMMTDYQSHAVYSDHLLHPGTYEYRLRAYDSFGDVTLPSEPWRVELPDLLPPSAPDIRYFQILRSDSAIHAIIYFVKDSIEEDLRGYLPLYHNDTINSGWIPLTENFISPTDTIAVVDVTHVPSGEICMCAVDTLGNYQMSMPKAIHIEDFTPPTPPRKLRGYVTMTGVVQLFWNPSPEPDTRSYQVYWANDLDQDFNPSARYPTTDTCFVDTLSLRVAQPYIYYYVVAYDWSGNTSDPSDTIRVERPNLTPPGKCRLDSISDDGSDDYIRSVWIASADPDLSYVRVFRRREVPRSYQIRRDMWTLVATVPADSIIDNVFTVVDSVPRDINRAYVYAAEAVNRTGLFSELSNQMAYYHRGANLLPITIKLEGNYRQDDRAAILAWETSKMREDWTKDAYYCVYRQMEDGVFRFMTSARLDSPLFKDTSIPRGQTATYRVRLVTPEGRFSPYSNTITITNTLPPTQNGEEEE